MVKRFWFGILFSVLPFVCVSQLLEFTSTVKLPVALNSNGEEALPLLSPDGKKLYFTRALFDGNDGGVYGGQDIWISDYTVSGWKKASNSISINNKNNNTVVGISKDGKTIYYVNASPSQKMQGIYAISSTTTSRANRGELIPIPSIDNLDFIGFYVSPDLDVIFLSMKAPDTRGNEDLYYSTKDKNGAWSKPQSLGATVNTSGFEISPFLSADKKRLYFSSNGHKGLGDADIFYSERLYDSWETWSVPVNLGKNVNSEKFDAYFSIYGDSVGYFSSNREGKFADLYSVKAKQGKTILVNGQHYLTQEEWETVVGKNVSADLAFPNKSAILSPGQKELLFYIVNKLMLKKDIKFHLVIKEQESDTLSKQRMKALYDHLKQLGIDPVRVYSDQIFDIENTARGVVEVRLFQ